MYGSDGMVGVTRRVFLTEWRDSKGNALTFTYDAQLRLVAVSGPVGQVTTLDYALPQDIWRVTSVTDPFGRTAAFAYDQAGRLASSTDVIGMRSSPSIRRALRVDPATTLR